MGRYRAATGLRGTTMRRGDSRLTASPLPARAKHASATTSVIETAAEATVIRTAAWVRRPTGTGLHATTGGGIATEVGALKGRRVRRPFFHLVRYNGSMETHVASLIELEQEAVRFVSQLSSQTKCATLITLSGELGAGKTTFTQAVARVLGIEDSVTSPTFVLEKIYTLGENNKGFSRLVHIDAYRLKSGRELGALGFDEILQDSGNLVMLEWPERVLDGLGKPTIQISILAHEDGSRTLTYD